MAGVCRCFGKSIGITSLCYTHTMYFIWKFQNRFYLVVQIACMVEFKSANDFRLRGGKYFMPCISIDCVIFGFHDSQLKVLLLTIANFGGYGLPAGFIYKEEHIDTSAKRILCERTGRTCAVHAVCLAGLQGGKRTV